MFAPYLIGSLVGISVASSPGSGVPKDPGLAPLESTATDAEEPSPSSAAEAHEELRALLASCDQALGPGNCVAAAAAADVPWRAVVEFTERGVQVTLHTTTKPVVRQLEFSAADAVKQRRAAAGLLVAAMTAAAHLEERTTKDESAARANEARERRARAVRPVAAEPLLTLPVTPEHSPRFGLELAAAASPFVGAGRWGMGGLAAFTWWPSASLGISAEGRALHAPAEEFSANAVMGAFGLTIPLWSVSRDITLRLHPAAVLDLTHVFHVAGASGSQVAQRVGGRLALRIAVGGRLGPWLGVGVTTLSRAVEIQVDKNLIRRAPPVTLSLALGMRWEP